MTRRVSANEWRVLVHLAANNDRPMWTIDLMTELAGSAQPCRVRDAVVRLRRDGLLDWREWRDPSGRGQFWTLTPTAAGWEARQVGKGARWRHLKP